MSAASDNVITRDSAGTRAGTLCVWQKALLIIGLLWALIVVVPDVYRIYGNLGTFGFSSDNNGVIYDVSGPPAITVGDLKDGDRIDLTPAPCWSPSSKPCRDYLAIFGGMGGLAYVGPDTSVTLPIIRGGGERADVTMTAEPEPLGPL